MSAAGIGRENDGPLSSVSAPANVLLLAPALSVAGDDCPTVGSAGDAPTSLLLVLLHGSLESRLEVWRRRGGLPETVYVVCCERDRSAAQASTPTPVGSPGDDGSIRATTIASPGNLAALGRSMDQWLSAQHEADGQSHVCFDSLTTLLQYVDTKLAYQFFHSLLPRISDANALAHFHMDASAHDETTGRIVRSLFDETFRYDEVGDGWSPV